MLVEFLRLRAVAAKESRAARTAWPVVPRGFEPAVRSPPAPRPPRSATSTIPVPGRRSRPYAGAAIVHRKKLTIERVYPVISLGVFNAATAEPAAWIRGHGGIENLLRHVCDRPFRKDDSRVRTGTLSRAMASLRNLVISLFRENGEANTAAAPPPAAPAATTTAPYTPSASREEPGQILTTQ